jgi:hypothetical protein
MVAGGLAAPSLALAAFFLSNSGGSATPARRATQAGKVTAPAAAAKPSPGAAAPVTTSTTAPGPAAVPPRDPFAPLVTQAPPPGSPGR